MKYYQQNRRLCRLAFLPLLALIFLGLNALAQEYDNNGVPEGYMIIEGDIIVPEDFYETQGKQAWRENTWWPGGIVPFEFDTIVVAGQQAQMISAMSIWENIAGVDFVIRAGEADYVHIQASASVNNSWVGKKSGEQIINIVSWNNVHIIAHELMHCLGFWHEQSRPARDQFVTVQLDSVPLDKRHNFEIHGDAGEWGYYDFTSLMHYGECDFSICGCGGDPCCCDPNGEGRTIVVKPEYSQFQSEIGQRDSISYLDSLSMMFAYPPDPWWKFLSKDADGLFPDGSFPNPYQNFGEAETGTQPGGVLWIIAPGEYEASGLHKKPIILTAPLGGVVLSD